MNGIADKKGNEAFFRIFPAPLWEQGQTGYPGSHTVSYTHLRAHETGRNLVCRLLLEKKNNKIDIPVQSYATSMSKLNSI